MDQNDFTMNKRYWVCPSANTVFDSALQMGQRLEPRVMALLCTLSAHAGRLVTRELLVKEIWKDYGGGEEGLTYAVSSLRRVLNDTTKTLIENGTQKRLHPAGRNRGGEKH